MRTFTITNARVFSAGNALPATAVRVVDGAIVACGDASIAPPGYLIIDAKGGTLLPGLIDWHVHLLPGSAQLAALFGVTTMLDLFSKPEVIGPERALADAAGGPGAAQIRSSRVGATAPGGHPTMAYAPFPYVAGPADAERFVTDRLAEGADHLKLIYDDGSGAMLDMPTLSLETMTALVDAAHAHDLVVVAHVSTSAGAVAVARAGVDVLGHVPGDRLADAQLAELVAAGLAVIPTLGVLDGFPLDSGQMPLLAEQALAERLPARWAAHVAAQADRWLPPRPDPEPQWANVAALHAAGVPILAGTDAPNPGLVHGASLHRELHYLVAAGLRPAEALAAATSVPARVFGLADRGVIEPGARADLLLVEGDATTEIGASHRDQPGLVGWPSAGRGRLSGQRA